MKPLSTADFGKVMKQVYPRVRPRRLGTRGNSRYCYAGLRKRLKLEAPLLPDVSSNATPTASAAYASSDLVTAAWCVVKEWAEALLGAQFVSLQALAGHLVEKVSVNTNTMAACLVASSATERNNNGSNSKHRETQMQLQRKLQQKEAKRKLQLGGGGGGLKRAKSSNQVCDKTADLTTLPERKQTATQQVEDNEQNDAEYVFCDTSLNLTNKMLVANAAAAAAAKLPIPRLVSTKSQQTAGGGSAAATTATKKQKTPNKYKTLQPKPAKCDKDVVVKVTTPDRSQQMTSSSKRQMQQQRFAGTLAVDKDALDDYLISGGNSQEQEEELMQYFNSDPPSQPPPDNKLSQLRLLLQQNYKAKLGPPSLQARRRVSFETQQDSSSVPPSPNTRRKNFSFTPISPGPLSPSTASPFVSPRNTPVPKTRRLLAVESAPPSPMQTNQLKAGSAYAFPHYPQDYFQATDPGFRSQSVPLGQQFVAGAAPQATPQTAEFADFETSLNDTGLNTENFNKILNILDNSQTGQQMLGAEFDAELGQAANVFQFDAGFAAQSAASSVEAVFGETLLPNLRHASRGQSTRSVPSTPLPSLNLGYMNSSLEITSRSYPSTPTDTMLRYGGAAGQQLPAATSVAAQDFLLNGQPVKELFGSVDEMMYSATSQQRQQQQQQQDNKMVGSSISSSSSTTASYQNCNYGGYADYVPSNGHSNV